MHGLRDVKNLLFMKGKEICQVAIGAYDVQFNWGDGGISVKGKFCYRPGNGEAAVTWSGSQPEVATRTVRLLKQTVERVAGQEDGTPTLTFSNGDVLEIYDPNPQYEAYSIRNGKNPVIIV